MALFCITCYVTIGIVSIPKIKKFEVQIICFTIYTIILALSIALIILLENRRLSNQINVEKRVELDPPPEYCMEKPPPTYEEALKIGI